MADPKPVLSVRDLVVEFPHPERAGEFVRTVDRVDFDLWPGEVLGVVGESGSGKTLTMLSVMGLIPAPGRISQGEVNLDGVDLLSLSPHQLRRHRGHDIGMIFQHPASSFNPLITVGRQIAEALQVHQPGMTRRAWRSRTVELLKGVGVPDPGSCFARYPHEYSGGMLQRAMIAMAIANSPKVLIADEPTTALDVTIQAQVLDLLRYVREQTGTAIILVTHNLGLVSAIGDRLCVMYASRVVERGPVQQVLSAPTHPYTAALLDSLPRMGSLEPVLPIPGRMPSLDALPSGCAFHPRCRLSGGREVCAEKIPALRPLITLSQAGRLAKVESACHFAEEQAQAPAAAGVGAQDLPVTAPPERAEPLLEVSGLRKVFRLRSADNLLGSKQVRAVDGVDLVLYPGRALALIGESGCGKSTLARTVVRLSRPDGGSIRFEGQDITRMRGERLRRMRPKMQMVFQDPASALDPRLTAWDVVAEPLRYHDVVTGPAVDERVAGLLEMVELDPRHARRRPHEYSGGQQQRIAIARSLALSPAMLVLDEPLSALDVSVQAGVINMLNRVRRELSLSYLVISHDLSVVQHLCEDVSVMYLGKVVETGPTTEVFAHPRHPYTRALLSAVPDPSRSGETGRIVLEGEVPSPTNPPSGCRFRTRCWKAQSICAEQMPPLAPDPAAEGRSVACHFPE